MPSYHFPEQLCLPFENHRNLPFISGQMDGRPCRFLFDSGGQDIVLNCNRLERKDESNETTQVSGYTGATQMQYMRLGKLDFNGWQMEGLEVLAQDLSHLEEYYGTEVDGIIGFKQIIHYDWMLDFDALQLHLWERFPRSEYEILQKVRLQYRHHLPLIEIQIGERSYRLLLDTGAPYIVMNEELRDQLADHIEIVGKESIQSASTDSMEVEHVRLAGFQLGELAFGASEMRLGSVTNLQRAFGEVDGIIGYDLLRQKRLVVSWDVHSGWVV